MIVLNIVRNGSLCSSIAFEKEVFSHQNDTRLLARNPLFLSGSTDKFVQQGCFFLPPFSCNFDDQFSSNFHRLVILCFNMYGLMLGVGGGAKWTGTPPAPPSSRNVLVVGMVLPPLFSLHCVVGISGLFL